MDFEITIGREVSGAMDIQVPQDYSKVGRIHAKIICNNSNLFIEDLNSSNGSYINGRRVSKKELHTNDIIFLGSKDHLDSFQLPVSKVMDDIKKLEQLKRTDFTNEFKTLVLSHNQYNAEKIKMRKKSQQKGQMPKLIISIGVGLILLIITYNVELSPKAQKLVYPTIMLVTAAGGFVSMIGGGKNDIAEDMVDLEIKYQDKYRCPKCNKKYNLNMHWKKLAKDKKCPHGCGAIFVLDTK
jgi:ribosomal protein L37AE/L43A